MTENKEITHNSEALNKMAELKYSIDRLMVANINNVPRFTILSLSPRGDKDKVSLVPELSNFYSYGTVIIEAAKDKNPINVSGQTYYPLRVKFSSTNSQAENIVLEYIGGQLLDKNGLVILKPIAKSDGTATLSAVVPADFKPLSLSGNQFAVIKYHLSEIVRYGSNFYGVISISVEGWYNG